MNPLRELQLRVFEKRRRLAERWHNRFAAWIMPIERAQAVRKQRKYCGTYIGVTGSCGKSTTAKLAAGLLAASGSVQAGSLINIERAVLRTLRYLDHPVDYVVQEISAHGGPGSLASITSAVRIDAAIVTAVNREHWEAYRDLNLIAAEKSQLVRHATRLACLNADDPLVRDMAKYAKGQVLLYGTAADADIRAENVHCAWPDGLSFDLVIGNRRRRVTTRFVGPIMLPNVLAALALVHGLGADLDAAIDALGGFEPLYQHGSVHHVPGGHSYLLDSAKAPYWSTEMMIGGLPQLQMPGLVFVLGQIAEKGSKASGKYRRLLRSLSSVAGHVLVVGEGAGQVESVRQSAGATNLHAMANVQAAAAFLADLPPTLVVIKGGGISKLTRVYLGAERTVTCARLTCPLRVDCRVCPRLSAEAA